MQLIDIVKISLSNAVRGRMRALLTAISIAIGVSSVMLISTLGDSGKMVINRELDRLGISGVTIYSKDSTRAELTTDDAKKLRERVRGIEVAQPLVIEIGGYNANNGRGNVVLWGVDSKINQILDIEMLHGRMPNSADVKFGNNVVVIDETVAMSNFHRENAVGKEVVLSVSGTYEQFKIIGVMRSQKDGINKLVGGEIPEFTYLPYTTLNRMRSSTNISQIAIKCAANLNSEKISKDAVAVLERTNHLKDSYGSENMSGHVSKLKNIAGLVALLISAIAAIS
ncbi:MAG: ABC transporter permease, partial [Clostridia bacterium]